MGLARQLLVAGLALAFVCLLAAAPASARHLKTVCPDGGTLTYMPGTSDRNGDGFVCVKSNGGVMEDFRADQATVSQDQCPAGYNAEPGNAGSSIDANGNGIVCVDEDPNSPTYGDIVDDNPQGAPAPVTGANDFKTVCPAGSTYTFLPVPLPQMPVIDRNGNNFVCYESTTNTYTDY